MAQIKIQLQNSEKNEFSFFCDRCQSTFDQDGVCTDCLYFGGLPTGTYLSEAYERVAI